MCQHALLQVDTEVHPAVTRHLVSVVASCVPLATSLGADGLDLLPAKGEAARRCWQLLTRLHAEHRNSETRCALTQLMALLVSFIADAVACGAAPWCGVDKVASVMQSWCRHLQEASGDVDNIDRRCVMLLWLVISSCFLFSFLGGMERIVYVCVRGGGGGGGMGRGGGMVVLVLF